jgi:hypothetical protein
LPQNLLGDDFVTFSLFLMIVAIHSVLDSLGLGSIDWVFLLILVIIGLVIIVLIKLFLVLIPAILVAILVWFLTGGDLFWTGVAFLVVALISIIAKI